MSEGSSVYQVRQECERLGFRLHFTTAGESVLTPAHLLTSSEEADVEAYYGSDLDDALGAARAMASHEKRIWFCWLLEMMQQPRCPRSKR